MSEIITVRWAGAGVAVEMRPVRHGAHDEVGCRSAYGEIEASGSTAQEALDALATQLQQVAEWATAALRLAETVTEKVHESR